MQAARVVEFGEPETLRVVEIEEPRPAADEVLIAVRAAGVNPSDVANLAGRFSQTTLPRTPGRDYAGVVAKGPSELLGKEVWGTGGDLGFTRDGSHAQYVVVPRSAVREKPTMLSMEQAAAVGAPFVTAWLAMVRTAQVTAGETLLVTGSRGAVGSAAVQIARWRGVRTIGVQRGTEGGDADLVVDSEREDVAKRVLELTSGRGASACLDTVGGALLDAALACLGLRGRLVAITAKGDGRVSFDLRDFYHRELRLLGVDSLKLDSTGAAEVMNELRDGFTAGALRVPSIQVYPLAQASEAYAALASGRATGKPVLLASTS
ncbi:MAG: zinc-binding alcohol dehydrogenase family protein [Bryobacteraceae bacterium]|jgi:NADPH:quinone reductase-like Zn-dependent oxidoreductase